MCISTFIERAYAYIYQLHWNRKGELIEDILSIMLLQMTTVKILQLDCYVVNGSSVDFFHSNGSHENYFVMICSMGKGSYICDPSVRKYYAKCTPYYHYEFRTNSISYSKELFNFPEFDVMLILDEN